LLCVGRYAVTLRGNLNIHVGFVPRVLTGCEKPELRRDTERESMSETYSIYSKVNVVKYDNNFLIVDQWRWKYST
jgi:hypothetical protein